MKNFYSIRVLLISAICCFASYMAFAQCTAGFTKITTGGTTTFTNTCSGAITPSFSWNFGDGSYSSSANPTHTYNYNGTYTVCLQYSGDSLSQPGCQSSFCDTVQIVNSTNPPCDATFTTYEDQGTFIVYFSNPSAYNVQWLWDFGDGNTSSIQNPNHQYTVNGTYNICLTAINTTGDTCTFCDSINSTPCSQILSTTYSHVYDSNTVTFTSSCSGLIIPVYSWNFGDGNSSALQNPVHLYQYNGIYNACLTYGDSTEGCMETYCDTININNAINPPCNVLFGHYNDSMPSTLVVFWSYSPIQTTSWFWDFGDGSTDTVEYPVHTYTTSGVYDVCLSVVRSYYGDTCTICDTVNISVPGNICGSVFSDANANCFKDIGDNSISNWMVKAQDSISLTNYYGVADSAGNYSMSVPSGNYLVSLLPLNSYWNQVCPVAPLTYSVYVAQQTTVSNINFGLQPVVSCHDLSVNIGATNQRRCLQNNYFVVQGSNNGTVTVSNVLLKVDFDNPLGRIIPKASTLPWDSVSGTEYFWKLGTMTSGQSVSFTVTDSVSCFAASGDTLHASSFISPQSGDCNTENNVVEDFQTVTGSFDPNEKKVVTTSNKLFITQGYILASDTLDYHIGFQNTGTDTAFTVTVFDTLDSHLNIQSLVNGVSTHAYTFEVLGSDVLKWTFNNILLPDSNINEPLSHGFFEFRILQKPNNPVGTIINNRAGIIFDYNEPVITDLVVLTVTDLVKIDNGGILAEKKSLGVFPNPNNGKFTVKINEEQTIDKIELYNILGEDVKSVYYNDMQYMFDVDISDLPQGIYFIKVTTSNGVISGKILYD